MNHIIRPMGANILRVKRTTLKLSSKKHIIETKPMGSKRKKVDNKNTIITTSL